MNFSPKRATEREVFTVDFADLLGSGETILSNPAPVWTIFVFSGADADPSVMIDGAPSVQGSKVSTWIKGGVAGVAYKPLCKVTTSTGQELVLPEDGDGFLRVT